MPKDATIGELTNSRSQILDYLNCGYRWDLGYRRGISSAGVSEAMDMGSAVHRGFKGAIASYVKRGAKWTLKDGAKAITAEVEAWAAEEAKRRGKHLMVEHEMQIRAIADEAPVIARRGVEHFELPKWEVATLNGKPIFEMELMVPLPPWKGFRTIPDLVARERGTKPWYMIDWKSRGSFESDDAEEINLQFSTMQRVLHIRAKNINIVGSLLWQLRSQAPRLPQQNKDGKMSRAYLACDWPTYEAALKAAKLNPADYIEEMKPKLEKYEWFKTLRQHRSLEECEAIWDQIVVPVSARMAQDPQTIRRFVHQPFGCSGCWARNFCLAELRGDDTDFLLETDFMDTRKPRPRREMGEMTRQFELA